MDSEQLGRVIAAFPQILGLSVELKIRPLMTYAPCMERAHQLGQENGWFIRSQSRALYSNEGNQIIRKGTSQQQPRSMKVARCRLQAFGLDVYGLRLKILGLSVELKIRLRMKYAPVDQPCAMGV